MVVDLPVSEPDPLAALRAIAAETRRRKTEGAEAVRALMSVVFELPRPLRGPLLRRLTGVRVLNLIVSNVAGPAEPLYLMGGRLREAYPFPMLSPRHAVRVAAVSYAGSLFVGINADPEVIGDPTPIARGLDRTVGVLRTRLGLDAGPS